VVLAKEWATVLRTINSVGECYRDKVEVAGSNPALSMRKQREYRYEPVT
jgi:hypothetical protein